MTLRRIYPSKAGQRGLRLFYIEDTETGEVFEPEQCPHDWQPMTSGGSHFSDGEVWDDTRDYLVCSVCGAEIDQLPADAVLEETEIPF